MSRRFLFRAPTLLFALVVLLTQQACAPYKTRPSSREPVEPVIGAPRSERGNPPYYEVNGSRYHVLDSSDGYRDAGVASWYGDDFHGRQTSSGEPYDMYAFTAAHKTLPIPTWVEVTNRANGRSVIVKVNDRGPFVNGRLIDLSYAAAQEIDMLRAGTASVFVRALGAPATMLPTESVTSSESPGASDGIPPATAAASLPLVDTLKQIFVQVGAFASVSNAERLVRRLRESGLFDAFVVPDVANPSGLHLVRIGPLLEGDDFGSINRELRRMGIGDSRLVSEP